jgi:cobalt-zinc-cadmium efflux system protein
MHAHGHGEHEAEREVLRGLRIAVELSLVILVIEVVGAYFSRSLSLTVDAVHNVPDILAFTVSLGALGSAAKGSSGRFTFGTHRLEIFAGLLNAFLVMGTGLVFGLEAVLAFRSGSPFAGPVDAVWLLVAAVPTLGLRALTMGILGRLPGRVRDLNLSSVIVHLASDVAITGALLFAGATLWLRPGWGWADDVAALAIGGVLVYESLPLFRQGWEILTERTPRSLSVEAISRAALTVPGVAEVHDVHVWSVCSTLVCLTACVEVADMPLRSSLQVVRQLREKMEKDFGILHATFEVECPAAR